MINNREFCQGNKFILLKPPEKIYSSVEIKLSSVTNCFDTKVEKVKHCKKQ